MPISIKLPSKHSSRYLLSIGNNTHCLCILRGNVFFRIFGYGLQLSTYRDSPPLFSEREGYRTPVFRTRYDRVFILTPIKPLSVKFVDDPVFDDTVMH